MSFQANAFQASAFQVAEQTLLTAVDSGGWAAQQVMVDRGNSIGLQLERVGNQQWITLAQPGQIQLSSNYPVVLVDTAEPISLALPSRGLHLLNLQDQHRKGFGGGIWIKDMSGHASINNITVHTFAGFDLIDGLPTRVINTDFGILRVYPLNAFPGGNWMVG